MTVLVLGATGFIGPHVIRALEAAGREVVAGNRAAGIDRRDVSGVQALVRARRVTEIVDLLAYAEADTLPLLGALDGKVGRWVMASSCDVYRNYEGLHRKASPEPIAVLAEDAPLRTTRYPYRADPPRPPDAADGWLDAYDKIPLEAALRARPSLDGVILRLPMVFGPGDRQRRFRWLLRPMLAGAERLAVDPAWATWRTSYGYVEDVGDAIAAAVLHRAAAGRTFNLGGPGALDHRGWIDRFAAVLGWRGEVAAAPASALFAALDLAYPLVVDTTAFRQACGWREPTPLDVALARTAADEASR